jgi:hypothetical protein
MELTTSGSDETDDAEQGIPETDDSDRLVRQSITKRASGITVSQLAETIMDAFDADQSGVVQNDLVVMLGNQKLTQIEIDEQGRMILSATPAAPPPSPPIQPPRPE